MNQDTTQLKEKIILIIKRRGPSLPVHIAGETSQSMLFASAFLSELFSEKKIKISNMRVGSSPLYFIPGQEPMLENFAHHLKSKEKDAYELIKTKKILKDTEQDPAIRVALREIKDFAIPFEKNKELFWRHFTIPGEDLTTKQEIIPSQLKEEKLDTLSPLEETKEEQLIPKKRVIESKAKLKKGFKKTIGQKKKPSTKEKKNEKFFNIVKEHLDKNQIQITDIIGFTKTDLILKIKDQNEKLLYAFNKKKISETDILKANKKAEELNLRYTLLYLGEPAKKITHLIEAIKNLEQIETLK